MPTDCPASCPDECHHTEWTHALYEEGDGLTRIDVENRPSRLKRKRDYFDRLDGDHRPSDESVERDPWGMQTYNTYPNGTVRLAGTYNVDQWNDEYAMDDLSDDDSLLSRR